MSSLDQEEADFYREIGKLVTPLAELARDFRALVTRGQDLLSRTQAEGRASGLDYTLEMQYEGILESLELYAEIFRLQAKGNEEYFRKKFLKGETKE